MNSSNKIAIAMVANNLDLNGISMVIVNYCSRISKEKFDVSILAGSPINDKYKKVLLNVGVHFFELPERKKDPIHYYRELNKVFLNKHYDIFHIHGNSATVTPEFMIAWLNKIKVRIMHCHNSKCTNIAVHNILLPIFHNLYTTGFACSRLAGKWIFKNNKFYVIPNGFEVEKFMFIEENRNDIRKQLHAEDKLVLGHIGRFNAQKNHLFLIAVFEKLSELRDDILLLLIGNGPDFSIVKQRAENSKYKERIIFWGETTNTAQMYAAMDIFVFPSKHEGLGIVLLEAQINGLPCLVSDVVPSDVVIGENIRFLSLESGADIWALEILQTQLNNSYCRKQYYEKYQDKILKYKIEEDVKELETIYLQLKNKET